MKRSELNSIIEDTIKFMEDRGLPLPPFAYSGMESGWQRERRDCRKYARMGYHRFRKWRF